MMVKWTIVFAHRNLSNRSIMLRVRPVNIAGQSSSKQRMIKAGIEFNLVLSLARLYFDSSEVIIPGF